MSVCAAINGHRKEKTLPPRDAQYATVNHNFPLPNFLRTAGTKAAAPLIATMRKEPKFAEAILKFYDFKDLVDFDKIVLDEALVTLAELLSAHGYATDGVLGSYPLSRTLGFAQGFATWDEDFDPLTSSYQRKGSVAFDRPADDTTRRARGCLGLYSRPCDRVTRHRPSRDDDDVPSLERKD